MLTLTTFLENYKGTYFLIKDREGELLYPKDKDALKFFDRVLSSSIDDNNLYNYKDYYFKYNSQLMSETIIEDNVRKKKVYIVESLEDVTNFEKEALNALTDVTTNLGGRRLTFERFNIFIMDSIYYERPFCCIEGDADNFKNINDTYGHDAGDEMLKHLGETLYNNTRHKNLRGNHVCRGVDVVGRIGGEEFLIVLNSVSLAGAYNLIEKIRKSVENSTIKCGNKTIPSCTMSFGMHYVDLEELKSYKNSIGYDDEEATDQIREKIIKKCDDALYESKNNGRNRTSIYGIKNKEDLESAINEKRCPINSEMLGQKRVRKKENAG